MLKLIIGKKGTGKTKMLIDMANTAVDATKGSVICIEKGDKLKYDIKYQCRLIDSNEYLVYDAQALYGFIAGIFASNHDVTELFVDSALKICENDTPAFEKFIIQLDELSQKFEVNCIVTSSIPVEEASDVIKKYI